MLQISVWRFIQSQPNILVPSGRILPIWCVPLKECLRSAHMQDQTHGIEKRKTVPKKKKITFWGVSTCIWANHRHSSRGDGGWGVPNPCRPKKDQITVLLQGFGMTP